MNRGYVRLWRKSLDAGWIKNHKLWCFWTYCLMKASHKEFDTIVGLQIVHLMPGQFIFGRRKAAEETGLSEREVRTILAFLINAGNLTIKTTNKYSVITIVNWPIYQSVNNENDQQNDQQVTSNRPHTRIKEYKNIYIVHHADQKCLLQDGVKEVLQVLNNCRSKMLGRNGLRPIISDKNIIARLKDGGSVYEACRIVVTKSEDPYFIENPKYFHPDTLFRKSHWGRYLDEAELLKGKH